jgi:hypothetical protein
MRLIASLLAASLCCAQNDPVEFFETKVRPVLAKNCFSCHTQSKLGGLEMTSREALLKGGNSGPAINVERPDESLLIQAIRQTHPRLKMPPTGKLGGDEIRDLYAWIHRGAVWPDATAKTVGPQITDEQRAWWAFLPVKQAVPPPVKDRNWPRGAVDQFILARLEKRGLKPVRPANRRDWLRRVTYDLTGLPPTPEEAEAFLQDRSASAPAKVIDRLLASPRFGERWGRHWLDVARYSDDLLNSTQDQPYDNAFRYRDWVIQAFNEDMPYDRFVKAQIAGDLMGAPHKDKLVAGLGFYALSPQFQDDRVDVTGKAFLGLTLGCAQCHDHKFDPIPTRDYYSLLGVFSSTEQSEFPLAPEDVVNEYRKRKENVEKQQAKLDKFLEEQAKQLSEVLAHRTAAYLGAARRVLGEEKADRERLAGELKLDGVTLGRWVDYLQLPSHEHPYLKDWREETKFDLPNWESFLLTVLNEQKEIEEKNFIRLGGSNVRGDLARADLLSLPRDKWLLWRDIFSAQRFGKFESGILYFKAPAIDRFLSGEWKAHLDMLRAELEARKKAVPEQYAYYHVIKDREKARTERVRIRGSMENLGEEAPRGWLSVLCSGEPRRFTTGSGRLELAESIADPANPLTARVMVNRIWHHLFGQGLVPTLSNFGQLGGNPSHPELLGYLANRFIESGWSIKSLIRELTTSSAYALSYQNDPANFAADPGNVLLWRSTRRRLDIESLRDSLLAASGELDLTMGGKPQPVASEKNTRRSVYSFVSRRKLDGTLALFDFPNPNSLSEQRIVTTTPLQQLYFLNSKFVMDRAKAFFSKIERAAPDDAGRIRAAYRMLLLREPDKEELAAGLAFLKSETQTWANYAQVLLSSNEYVFY